MKGIIPSDRLDFAAIAFYAVLVLAIVIAVLWGDDTACHVRVHVRSEPVTTTAEP